MRYVVGFFIGSAIGLTVGLLAKCTTGMCPLTNNPWITSFLGGMMGVMLAAKPPEKSEDRDQKTEDR
ncbi:MAG: hypothetical protein JW928_06170 [Candidatus Aureabacteria bacterium]|nr:hypothetical protein [Candidatus Auribacterota bacterium]